MQSTLPINQYERPVIRRLNPGMMQKSGQQQQKFVATTHIDGVAVSDLLKQYGSPLFVISERQIRLNYQRAVQAFSTRYPRVQFAWSYKTHYNNAVCAIFHQEGSWAEVVSGFEYRKALKNGVPGHHIIFNGPDKQESDLLLALKHESLIHLDHFEELFLLNELCRTHQLKARVAVRVNMDTGVYPIWDRFGFNFENGQARLAIQKIIESSHMQLCGLHAHIGTFMLSTNAYAIAAQKLCELAHYYTASTQNHLMYIDLGGGFPGNNQLKGVFHLPTAPSIDAFAEVITTVLLSQGWSQTELPILILESGRVLIDDAGYLLGTVLANKKLSDGRKATILDFGVNLMFTSFWYDHEISPAQSYAGEQEESILYGPLCMNIDVVRESASLPLMNRGDHVVVHRVGAYNMTQWMQFITLRPAIVLIDMERGTHVIRKSESLEYLEQLEQIPPHLIR